MPRQCAHRLAMTGGVPKHRSLPLVAADTISYYAFSPLLRTISFITNSAIGLRQIFPRQINKILFIFTNSRLFDVVNTACCILCLNNTRIVKQAE